FCRCWTCCHFLSAQLLACRSTWPGGQQVGPARRARSFSRVSSRARDCIGGWAATGGTLSASGFFRLLLKTSSSDLPATRKYTEMARMVSIAAANRGTIRMDRRILSGRGAWIALLIAACIAGSGSANAQGDKKLVRVTAARSVSAIPLWGIGPFADKHGFKV